MEHNWDLYFDTSNPLWGKLQTIYKANDAYPKVVTKNRNLHHKFMRAFSKLEGVLIDNDKDNLVSLGLGDHFLAHWLLWKCTKKGYRNYTASPCTLMYKKALKYLSLESVELIAKDWNELKSAPKSANHRKKIAIALQGNKNALGIKRSKETRQKMSEALKGIPKSEEHKAKLRGENNPMYGKHHSEESKRKMSAALSKKVFCVELDKEFDSIQAAALYVKIDRTGIYSACTGKQKTAAGYHWRYVMEEYDSDR